MYVNLTNVTILESNPFIYEKLKNVFDFHMSSLTWRSLRMSTSDEGTGLKLK